MAQPVGQASALAFGSDVDYARLYDALKFEITLLFMPAEQRRIARAMHRAAQGDVDSIALLCGLTGPEQSLAIRYIAVRALAVARESIDAGACLAAIACNPHEPDKLRLLAITSLVLIDGPAARVGLRKVMRTNASSATLETDLEIRATSAFGLWDVGGEEMLRRLANDKNARVRVMAAATLYYSVSDNRKYLDIVAGILFDMSAPLDARLMALALVSMFMAEKDSANLMVDEKQKESLLDSIAGIAAAQSEPRSLRDEARQELKLFRAMR